MSTPPRQVEPSTTADCRTAFEHGAIEPDAFAAAVRQTLGRGEAEMPGDELLDALSDMFTPIQRMEGVLDVVRQRGCGVGLLSNTCHAHWDWIGRQRYAVIDFAFDATILSYEVGSMKPEPAIYEAAEQACGVSPDRILFLDDKAENVSAAVDRGWNAVECLGGVECIDQLRGFGLCDDTAA